MKKLVALIVFIFGISITSFAQKNKTESLSVDQKTELKLKKMTLKFDLTTTQQRQIKPLIAQKISEHMAMKEKRKAMRSKEQKLTSEERYQLKSKMLDKQIAFKAEMKQILNEKQYERFEKSQVHRAHKAKKRIKKHKKRERSRNNKERK